MGHTCLSSTFFALLKKVKKKHEWNDFHVSTADILLVLCLGHFLKVIKCMGDVMIISMLGMGG